MKFALLAVTLTALAGAAQAKMSVPRSTADVMWAISESRDLPAATRRQYAEAIISESTEHNVDPFTMVSIINHESKFNSQAVGGMDGQCIGFGQTCLHRYEECTSTDFEGAACQERKAKLLNWRFSLSQIAADISAWRAYCRKTTGQPALFYRWLSGYAGSTTVKGKKGRPTRTVCGMSRDKKGRWHDAPRARGVKEIMNYRLQLIKKLERRRK